MGYFSSGSEGMDYQADLCCKCVHEDGPDGCGCPVWNAHLLKNYDECNNDDSILHMLIPRATYGNDKCLMFIAKPE